MVILKALMGWDINFGVMVLLGDDFGVLMVFFVLTFLQGCKLAVQIV
jgi:hypothetical protein